MIEALLYFAISMVGLIPVLVWIKIDAREHYRRMDRHGR